MRGYALALGMGLTVLFGLVAHAAMTAVPARAPEVVQETADSVVMLWYGGMLDPVTVVGRRGERAVVAETGACPPGRVPS